MSRARNAKHINTVHDMLLAAASTNRTTDNLNVMDLFWRVSLSRALTAPNTRAGRHNRNGVLIK